VSMADHVPADFHSNFCDYYLWDTGNRVREAICRETRFKAWTLCNRVLYNALRGIDNIGFRATHIKILSGK
jgi:hypothetical protein